MGDLAGGNVSWVIVAIIDAPLFVSHSVLVSYSRSSSFLPVCEVETIGIEAYIAAGRDQRRP